MPLLSLCSRLRVIYNVLSDLRGACGQYNQPGDFVRVFRCSVLDVVNANNGLCRLSP